MAMMILSHIVVAKIITSKSAVRIYRIDRFVGWVAMLP